MKGNGKHMTLCFWLPQDQNLHCRDKTRTGNSVKVYSSSPHIISWSEHDFDTHTMAASSWDRVKWRNYKNDVRGCERHTPGREERDIDTHSIAVQCSSSRCCHEYRIESLGESFFEVLWVLKLWWSPLPLWHSPRTWANFTSFSRSLVRCAMRVLGYTFALFLSRWRNADSSREIIFIWQLGREDREHTKWNGPTSLGNGCEMDGN